MRWLLSILLLLPFSSFGAITGNTNIIGAWVEPNGDAINFHIGGDAATFFGTNVQFFAGFLTSRATNFTSIVSGTQTCTLTIGSFGWSGGVNVAKTRTGHGTKLRRKPYPFTQTVNTNWVYAEDPANQTNVIVRIELSHEIYAGETVTLNTRDACIVNTNTGVHAARVTGITVTNLSALTFQDHSEPSINWAHPGQNRWTNGINYLYLDGGHWSGIDRILLRTIDENANTNFVTMQHVAVSPGRGPLHGLYVAAVDCSSFSNLNTLRHDYLVEPNIGTNVFDTRLDRWTGLTPNPASQTNFWDRFNVFTNFGIVTVGGGSSPTITNGPPENVHPDNYFPTVNAAFAALVLTNRNNIGISNAIGHVLARSSVSNMMGGTATMGPPSPAWAILKNYPGDTVRFTNITGLFDVNDCWKVEGDTSGGGSLTIDMIGAVTFSGIARLWLDNVTIDSSTSQLFASCTNTTFTDCTFTRLGQGINVISSQNTSFALGRDCDVSGVNGVIWIRTGIGLVCSGRGETAFQLADTRSSHGAPFSAHTILTDSKFLQLGGNVIVQYGLTSANDSHTNDVLHGFYSENVLFESTNNSSSVAIALWTFGNVTNVVIKNWTVVGARQFTFYNETTNKFRVGVHLYNNIFSVSGFANDLLPQNNPWATNSVAVLHHVGSSGNVHWFPTGSSSHNWPDFDGIDNIIPGVSGTKLSTNFVRFINNQGYINGITPGNGNYGLTSDNFIFDMGGNGSLPAYYTGTSFDGEANPRSPLDGPGYKVGGQVRMSGVGFF